MRINERNRFIDAGSGGHTFVDPNGARRELPMYHSPTTILGISGKKSGDIFDRCRHSEVLQKFKEVKATLSSIGSHGH